MSASRVSSVLLVVGCLAAAGVGGYLAVRQNAAADQPALAGVAPIAGTQQDVDLVAGPASVDETEVAVGEENVAGDTSHVATPASPPAMQTTRVAKSVEKRRIEPPAARAKPAESSQIDISSRTTSELERPGKAPAESPAPASAAHAPSDSSVASPADSSAQLPVETQPAGSDSVETELSAPEPRARIFEEFLVPTDSVIGIQMDTAVSSERAVVEDRVEARVTRDVKVGAQTAIPAGSRMLGSITLVEKGGKVKERARLGIRFHTLVLADNTSLPIQTETVYREGDSPASESAAKIGGAAVGGAILGAIFGGRKGAVLGGSAGAAGGTAAVMSGERNAATLAAGSTLTVRLSEPVTMAVER